MHLVVRLAGDCPNKLLFLLLHHGANCEWPDSTLNTPLHIASCSELRFTLLEFMLAGISEKGRGRNDPHYLERLLSCCVTQRGETPLMTAARYGHVSAVKLLLDTCYGETAERVALEEDGDREQQLLNVQDVHGETAIIAAAMRGDTEMVECMLKYNADTECVTDTGDTLYSLALMFDRKIIVQMILQYEQKRNRQKKRQQAIQNKRDRIEREKNEVRIQHEHVRMVKEARAAAARKRYAGDNTCTRK